jgi:hypothetical protein
MNLFGIGAQGFRKSLATLNTEEIEDKLLEILDHIASTNGRENDQTFLLGVGGKGGLKNIIHDLYKERDIIKLEIMARMEASGYNDFIFEKTEGAKIRDICDMAIAVLEKFKLANSGSSIRSAEHTLQVSLRSAYAQEGIEVLAKAWEIRFMAYATIIAHELSANVTDIVNELIAMSNERPLKTLKL